MVRWAGPLISTRNVSLEECLIGRNKALLRPRFKPSAALVKKKKKPTRPRLQHGPA